VWTTDGTYPYKTLVGAYKHLSRHPRQWQFLYHLSNFPLYEFFMDMHSCFMCEKKIRNRIASYNPDVVVSVHPAMNYTPVRAVKNICMEKSNKGQHHKIPFFTVVTDYGSAHCTWFQRRVEKIFVASERLRKLARRRGFIPKSKIVMAGLPIRQDFHEHATALGGDRTSPQGKAYRGKVRNALGIEPNSKAILLMGGGEGVGSLSDIVNALYKTLVQRGIDSTLLVVCGRNEKLRKQLRTRNWDDVLINSSRKARSYNLVKQCIATLNRRTGTKKVASHQQGKVTVVDLGFVNDMAEYMVAADVLVSKAGPGTIAEAAAVGLPVMLSR
jgi:1,2-diacylglycerol 3-beta-galactosyltransferase